MTGADEMRAGWPVVMACFVTAVIGWGFGLYGQSVYVADLHATRGWSTALVSSASTVTYLAGAGMIVFTPRVAELLGPRIMLIAGAVIISAGAAIEARASAPWQVFLGAVVVAWGWGWTSITAIATTLAQWFDALTSAGFVVERFIEPKEDGLPPGPDDTLDNTWLGLMPYTLIMKARKR